MRAGAAINLSSRRKPPPCSEVFISGALALKTIDAGRGGVSMNFGSMQILVVRVISIQIPVMKHMLNFLSTKLSHTKICISRREERHTCDVSKLEDMRSYAQQGRTAYLLRGSLEGLSPFNLSTEEMLEDCTHPETLIFFCRIISK